MPKHGTSQIPVCLMSQEFDNNCRDEYSSSALHILVQNDRNLRRPSWMSLIFAIYRAKNSSKQSLEAVILLQHPTSDQRNSAGVCSGIYLSTCSRRTFGKGGAWTYILVRGAQCLRPACRSRCRSRYSCRYRRSDESIGHMLGS